LALRHAGVALMKLVELCVLYGEEAPVLNRNERLEILRYAKSRLPIFLTQFVSLLRNVKSDFTSVRPSERNDIAAHVAPEIESLLETLSHIMKEAGEACSDIWTRWSGNDGPTTVGFTPDGGVSNKSKSSSTRTSCTGGSSSSSSRSSSSSGAGASRESSICEESVTDALYAIFRKREVAKLHCVQGQLVAFHLYLLQKK